MFGKFRYFFIPFAVFIFFYFFRLFQLGFIDISSLPVRDRNITASFFGQNRLYGENYPNSYLKVRGRIDSAPMERSGVQIFRVGRVWVEAGEIGKYNELFYGERVVVVGKPETRVLNNIFRQIWLINPEIYTFENMPLKERKQFGNSLSPLVELVNFSGLLRLKCQQVYIKALPEPQASLLSGIVLGKSDFMDWDFWRALKVTGTLHIIAASGMNVTMVAKVVIGSLILVVSRKMAYFVSLVFILIYCLLAGGSAAVIRAGLMAGIAFSALAFGREAEGGWLLFLAAGIMLLINPLLIVDVGFQLSVTAMLGMIYVRPMLERFITACRRNFDVAFRIKPHRAPACEIAYGVLSQARRLRGKLAKYPVPYSSKARNTKSHWFNSLFSNNLLDTLSAQIGTMPVLYFTFGQVQPLAFLPNLMVVPLVPGLMILGFVILAAGLAWMSLAYPLSWLAWPPLTYFVEVIKWWGGVL